MDGRLVKALVYTQLVIYLILCSMPDLTKGPLCLFILFLKSLAPDPEPRPKSHLDSERHALKP